MKITAISAQTKNPDRVNVSVDGKYRFSLDVYQVADLGIRVGQEYTEDELLALEGESQFGKLYSRTLEYCLMRPRSAKEVRDYLYRKTRSTKYKTRSGELKDREGVPLELTERVFDRLLDKGYVDDEKFARFWVENRNLRKGSSKRKLQAELSAKGVPRDIIDSQLETSGRDDKDELRKVIAKKARRYPDKQKFTVYLARQGFRYDDITDALEDL